MKRALALLILTAAMAACVGTKGPPLASRVYSLEYPPPAPAVAEDDRLKWSLRVDAFDAQPFIGTDRIVYRESPFQVDTYRYHRWQAPPARLVAWHLEDDLKSAGYLSAVIGSNSLFQATHVLEGTVHAFHEDDAANGWEAVVSVSLTLAQNPNESGGRRILMQRRYSARQPCRYRTPLSLAEAMSRALAEISAQALEDIYDHLAAVQ